MFPGVPGFSICFQVPLLDINVDLLELSITIVCKLVCRFNIRCLQVLEICGFVLTPAARASYILKAKKIAESTFQSQKNCGKTA